MSDGDSFDLKTIVRPIVLAQGNAFIKELLRDQGIKIGSTKADFEKNIFDAIDGGQLTRTMIEVWLLRVEGWGDQHVYPLTPPPVPGLDTLLAAIRGSAHAGLLDVGVSYEFPEKLTMTSVRLDHELLAVDWHLGLGGWERAKSKDHQREIDGELYEFRAWRDRRDRSIVRFEWRFGHPYCCLFTQLPNEGEQHQHTLQQVFADLTALGVIATPLNRVPLSKAVKTSTQDDGVVAHSTRMSALGGYVELASTVPSAGIGDIEAIRRVRQGVQDSDFGSAQGMLSFPRTKHEKLSRDVKATIYGSEGRFRIWVQCQRDDIYVLADLIWQRNS
jgi:hypothetical protein